MRLFGTGPTIDPNAPATRATRSGVSTGFLYGFIWSIFAYYWYDRKGEAYCSTDLGKWHLVNWTVSLSAFSVSLLTFGVARCTKQFDVLMFSIDMVSGIGCTGFLIVWWIIGNTRLWGTHPCFQYHWEEVGGIWVEVYTEETEDCCDTNLWWNTQTYFIITYVFLGILVCCGCCMICMMAASPQMREAADRVRRGERMEDVIDSLRKGGTSSGGSDGGSKAYDSSYYAPRDDSRKESSYQNYGSSGVPGAKPYYNESTPFNPSGSCGVNP